MSLTSKRLVGIVASTALLSLVSAAAHAQTIDVLTGGGDYQVADSSVTTEYTFSSSMILNSIGFLSRYGDEGTFEYSIDNLVFSDARTSSIGTLNAAVDGVRWLNLSSSITLNKDAIVRVRTSNTLALNEGESYYNSKTTVREFQTLNLGANVSYNTFDSSGYNWTPDRVTNSNLKVSNPSANVAPEPGSFALALTGGATLIGICIRRRRNAG
jgi:hypothetical protein